MDEANELDTKVGKEDTPRIRIKRIFKNPFYRKCIYTFICIALLVFGFLIGTGISYEEPTCPEPIKCPAPKECPKAVNTTKYVVPICPELKMKDLVNNSYVLGLINQIEYLEEVANECHFYNETEREEKLKEELKECNNTLEEIKEMI